MNEVLAIFATKCKKISIIPFPILPINTKFVLKKGRYVLSCGGGIKDLAQTLGKELKIKRRLDHQPRYDVNGFDNPLLPVVAAGDPDYLRYFRWRLIPNHIQDPKAFKANTLNARSEEIFEKSFTEPIGKTDVGWW